MHFKKWIKEFGKNNQWEFNYLIFYCEGGYLSLNGFLHDNFSLLNVFDEWYLSIAYLWVMICVPMSTLDKNCTIAPISNVARVVITV